MDAEDGVGTSHNVVVSNVEILHHDASGGMVQRIVGKRAALALGRDEAGILAVSISFEKVAT